MRRRYPQYQAGGEIPSDIRRLMGRMLQASKRGDSARGLDTLLSMASGGRIPGYQTGGAPTQQRMVQSYVSPEQQQLAAQLTGNIQQIASQPYAAYGGQRLAATTGDQALARAAYGAYGRGTGPAGTQQAAQAYTQAQQMVGGAAQGLQGLQPQYGQLAQQFAQGATGAQQLGERAELQGQLAGAGMRATGVESQQQAGEAAQAMRGVGQQAGAPQMQTQANLQDYMSQYTKGVTDPQLEALREFQQIQGQELASQAATTGNLGSMRQGVQAAQQARDVSRQAADIIGGAQQDAFASAQQAFQADRAAQQAGLGQQLTAEQQAALAQSRGQQQALLAQQQGYGAAQGGTQLGLQGLQASGQMLGRQQGAVDAQGRLLGQVGQMGTQMANMAGGIGAQAQREQQMQMQRLQAMEQAGARTQQEQQRDYDIGYQDFLRQQQYPQQQTQAALSMMNQLPYQNTQVISDYQAAPGLLSDATGALAAYQNFQSQQNQGTGDPSTITVGSSVTPDPNLVQASIDNSTLPSIQDEVGAGELIEPPQYPDPFEGDENAAGGYIQGRAGGGYIGGSNLGILAPYHRRLIDGLYAGGRIHYQ